MKIHFTSRSHGLSISPSLDFTIQRILEHLGLWAPLATERSPPLVAATWPRHASLPLTYHPVPDIA